MKCGLVDNIVKFAHEMPGSHDELGMLLQRGISKRTEDIKNYLLESEHRFLGALIVAAWAEIRLSRVFRSRETPGL